MLDSDSLSYFIEISNNTAYTLTGAAAIITATYLSLRLYIRYKKNQKAKQSQEDIPTFKKKVEEHCYTELERRVQMKEELTKPLNK